jgi:prophage regulatory protein
MSRRYLRLPQVLERIPVSKSTWWAGVKKGIFPKPMNYPAARSCEKMGSDKSILFVL